MTRQTSTLIRNALPSDVGKLIALSQRTIQASYSSFLGGEPVDAYIASGAVDRYVEENIVRCVVILRDEEIVGYAVWREDLIDLMMIDHSFHRQGLGTLLLRHLEAALFQVHDALRLESFEGNANANAFYRKNGWRELSRHFDSETDGNKILFGKRAVGPLAP
ncbi:MAG: GNAT family N-acetyltransferase [Planctomycetota bacterium]